MGKYASLDNWHTCLHVFCNKYLRRGLTQGDEIWQDGRPGWVADISPLVKFGPGVSPQGQKVNKFDNAYLVDCLRDRAEILHHGGEVPSAGLHQAWHFGTIKFHLG